MSLIVDVGGGYGELIASILSEHPSMRGILFDLAHATAAAGSRLAAAGVEGRCTLVTGSFFDAIPGEADAYLLKSVLHDWDDDHASAETMSRSGSANPTASCATLARTPSAPDHLRIVAACA